MKKWLSILLTVAFAVLALGAVVFAFFTPAKNGAQDMDASLLHGGYTRAWKLTQYSVDGVMKPAPNWAADNILLINSNGTGAWLYGEVDKDESDTRKYDSFDWLNWGNQLFSYGAYSTSRYANIQATILKLSTSEMIIESTVYDESGYPAGSLRYVYQPAVVPKAGITNREKLLTHGSAKIWVMVEMKENGQTRKLPAWMLDDGLVFCADGTGYQPYGEIVKLAGDTTNNDRFGWSLSTDGSTLQIHGDNGPTVTRAAGWKIQRLEENLLVLEGTRTIDNKDTLVTITYIPLLSVKQ